MSDCIQRLASKPTLAGPYQMGGNPGVIFRVAGVTRDDRLAACCYSIDIVRWNTTDVYGRCALAREAFGVLAMQFAHEDRSVIKEAAISHSMKMHAPPFEDEVTGFAAVA